MRGLGRWLLLGCCLLGGVARADGPVTVELVLFRYTEAMDPARWPPTTGTPDFASATALQPAPDSGEAGFFTALPKRELRLAAVSTALRRAGAYEVLLHTAWRQPARAAGPIYVQSEPPAEGVMPALEGNLQLREAGAAEIRLSGNFLVQVGDQQVKVSPNQNLRPQELRYIDHALLGLLVQVTPDGDAADASPAPPTAAANPGPAD